MQLSDAILARRAVRAYEPTVPPEATLRGLLEAAVQAPSAMNAQPWTFSIVQDRARLVRWSTEAKALLLGATEGGAKARRYDALLRDEGFCIFYDAPVLVVIGVRERGPYTDADCWLAAQNLMLAATDTGLGTCCIGFAVPVLNTPAVKRELGLPESGVAIAPVIVGTPRGTAPVIPRSPPHVAAWLR